MGKTTHHYGPIRLAAGAIAIALLLAAALPLFGASNADVLFYEGVNAYLRGDVPAAADALGRALQTDPGHERAQRLLQEVNAELARRNPSRPAGSPVTPARPVAGPAPTAATLPAVIPSYPVATQPYAVMNPVPLTGPIFPAGPGEGLVSISARPADVPTAVAVPVAPLQPLLRERLSLRGTPDAGAAGRKSLTAIEVYSENYDLKVRLTGSAGLDFLESKVYAPPMVVIDLPGCRDALPNHPLAVEAGGLVRVRHTRGRSEPLETTRVILDLTQVIPYSIERVAGGVVLTFPNAGQGTGARAVLGEPPFFTPRQTLTTPLSTYRVQSQWLRIVSGEKQLGPAGSRLAAPLAVQVTDAQGTALAEVPVTFTVTEGNGYFLTAGGEKVAALTVATDGNGQAFAGNYFLATQAGDNVILAALGEARASGVTFLETSLPGAPVELARIHGDEQEGLTASPLEEPLVVEVRDRYGNPVSAVRVIFTVLFNDGVADANPNRWGTQSVVTTDEHGRARLEQFKLGTRVGLNRVRASIIVDDAADVRGGLIITPRRFEGRRPGEVSEIRREHPATDRDVLIEEIFRYLPTAAEEEITLVSVGNINEDEFRLQIVNAARETPAAKLFSEINTVYVEVGSDSFGRWEERLAALTDAAITRRVIRSVQFREYGRPQVISVDFRDASVVDVIRTLAEIANWNIVFPGSGDALYNRQVTIHLLEVPAKTVLDNILGQIDYARVEANGIIKIVPIKEVPINETRIGSGTTLDEFEGEEDEIITYFFTLKYRKPSDLTAVVATLTPIEALVKADDPSGKLIVTDRVANLRRIAAVIRQLDSPAGTALGPSSLATMTIRLVTLQHSDAATVKTMLDLLIPLLPAPTGGTVSFLVIPYAGEKTQLLIVANPAIAGLIFDVVAQIDAGRQFEVLAVAGGLKPSEIKPMLDSFFGAAVSQAFDNASRLLIYGTPETLAQIKGLVAQLNEGRQFEVLTVSGGMKPSELKPMLDSYFGANVAIAYDNTNKLLVYGTPELLDKIKDLVGQLNEGRQLAAVTVSQAKPSELKPVLDSLFGITATQAIDNLNKLVIFGTPETIARIKEAIGELDAAGLQGKEVLVFSLTRIKPDEMSQVLLKLYPGLQVLVSPTGNYLIVLAPRDQVDELRAVVEKVDRNLTAIVEGNMQREVIRMERLDPLRAEEILKSSFPGAQIFALGKKVTFTRKYKDADGNNVTINEDVYIGLYGVLVIANRQDIDLMKKVVEAMDLSPFPRGFTMTVYSPQYQSAQNLVLWGQQMMGADIRQGKIFSDPLSNRLLIWDNEENTKILTDFFRKMDVSPNEGLTTRAVTLGNLNAIEMSQLLPMIYSGVFIPSTTTGKNQVFIQVPREVLAEVLETIRQLDQMPAGETVAVIPVSVYLTPSDIEGKLKTVFPNLNFISLAAPNPIVVVSGDEVSVRRVRGIIAEIDQPLVTRTIRLTYGDATSIASTLTTYLSTNGKVQADGRTNTLILTEVGSNLPRLERIIRDLDISTTGAGGESATTKVFPLKNAQATELVTTLASVVAATRGTGNLNVLLGSLSADIRTNSILVNSTASDLPLIASLIEQLDVRTPQVLIEATILEYNLTDNDNMGFQWNFADRLGQYNYSTTFGGLISGAFTLTLTKGQLSVVMDALQSTGRTEILAAPKIMTLNNKAANIVVGTTRQVMTTVTVGNPPMTTTSPIDKKADLDMTITPQIGADRTVKLDFALNLEQFLPVAPGTTGIPSNTRKLTNSVLIADEQTLVIGGIIRDEKQYSNSGIPFLRDLPGLGRIFSSTTDQKNKVELLIFLTPRVVASPAEGDQVTRMVANQAIQLTPLPVNINTAGFDELLKLPGLKADQDPRQAGIIASRIVRHRELYGPYQSLEELKFVPGIDDRIFEDIVYRLKYKVEVNVISIEELRQLKGVTLPIAKGLVDYRKAHGLFTEYDAVRKVFLSLGMPAETYDAYLGDIIYVGNVYREEREVSAGPAGPATFRPGPAVMPTPAGTAPTLVLPGPTPRTTGQGTRVTPPTPTPITPTPTPTPAPSASDAGKVNLNTATVDQLKGVGFDDLGARLVVAWRNRYGPYHAVEDLKGVIGITPALYERVKDKVTVGALPASEENGILLMPSVPVEGSAPPVTTISSAGSARLDLNLASAEELASVTGLDPMKAKMIVAYRHTYGDYTGVEQLRMVPTVTATDYSQVAPYLFVR